MHKFTVITILSHCNLASITPQHLNTCHTLHNTSNEVYILNLQSFATHQHILSIKSQRFSFKHLPKCIFSQELTLVEQLTGINRDICYGYSDYDGKERSQQTVVCVSKLLTNHGEVYTTNRMARPFNRSMYCILFMYSDT